METIAAALRAARVEHRRDLPLTRNVSASFGLVANNQVVALLGVPDGTPSWVRTRIYLETNLPTFAVRVSDANRFVAAWTARDLIALARFRVPLRGAAPSL